MHIQPPQRCNTLLDCLNVWHQTDCTTRISMILLQFDRGVARSECGLLVVCGRPVVTLWAAVLRRCACGLVQGGMLF